MIIINDKYAIDSDKRQWKICEYRKASENTPEHWDAVKFYTALPVCLEALRGILLRTSDYSSFADLERNAKSINRLLEKKLQGAIK